MTEDEEKAATKKDSQEEQEKLPESVIPQVKTYELQAIIFHNSTQWTVWVDGKPYTAQQPKVSSTIHVKAVSGQSIEVVEGSETTLLFTGQSYQGQP